MCVEAIKGSYMFHVARNSYMYQVVRNSYVYQSVRGSYVFEAVRDCYVFQAVTGTCYVSVAARDMCFKQGEVALCLRQ